MQVETISRRVVGLFRFCILCLVFRSHLVKVGDKRRDWAALDWNDLVLFSYAPKDSPATMSHLPTWGIGNQLAPYFDSCQCQAMGGFVRSIRFPYHDLARCVNNVSKQVPGVVFVR